MMQTGDIFFAYSDGVTEPENEFGEFGEDRLIALVKEHHNKPLPRITEIVAGAVADWIGNAEQPDDVTIVWPAAPAPRRKSSAVRDLPLLVFLLHAHRYIELHPCLLVPFRL